MKQIYSNDLIRLLSIIPRDRGAFWGSVVQYFFWHLGPIFTIIMLGEITKQFEIGNFEQFMNIVYIYVGGILVIHVINYTTQNIGWVQLYGKYHKVLHNIYMEKFVYLDTNEIERIGSGRCISILEKGFRSRSSFIGMGIEKVISLGITIIYFMRLLVSMGIWYMISFIIMLLGVMYVSYILNTHVVEARQSRVIAQNEYSRGLIRIIMSKVEVMQSRNKSFEMQRLDKSQNDAIAANIKMNPRLHWMFFAPQLVLEIVRISVFTLIGVSYFQGDVSSISMFVTLGAAFVLLDSVLDNYLMFFKDVTKEFDIVKKLWRLFDNHEPQKSYTAGKSYIYKNGDIHLKDMSFSYSSEQDEKSNHILFDRFSLNIVGGSKTALVGPSGSGKSTLVKLIAGYLRPDSGDIYIDGQKLSETSMKSYYGHIGYLTQEPSVFDGTIRENLEYGATSSSTDALNQAIKSARCEFIYDFPQGLDTEIGERGIRLSGGQRQRLAIAKIFLKNPKIIILDEPTSALDSESEEAVTKAMNTLFEGRTVIIIAHRLQTVKHADRIIYIEKGEIAESGTHQELIHKEGKYWKMVELQSGF